MRSSSLKLSLSIAVDSAPVNDDRDVVCSELIAVNLHEVNIAKIAELEHNVAVVLTTQIFQPETLHAALVLNV